MEPCIPARKPGIQANILLCLHKLLAKLSVLGHYTTLLNSFVKNKIISWSKVPTTTSGVLPGHILTNFIINALLDANPDRKLGKSPIVHSKLFAKSLRRQRSWSAWIPGLLTRKSKKKYQRRMPFSNTDGAILFPDQTPWLLVWDRD